MIIIFFAFQKQSLTYFYYVIFYIIVFKSSFSLPQLNVDI